MALYEKGDRVTLVTHGYLAVEVGDLGTVEVPFMPDNRVGVQFDPREDDRPGDEVCRMIYADLSDIKPHNKASDSENPY